MLTTAGLIRSTTSAKLTAGTTAAVFDARSGGRPEAAFAPPPADTSGRESPPARMAPTRRATTAVSTSVTNVKRRILLLHYKGHERGLIQHLDPELMCFLELGSGV